MDTLEIALRLGAATLAGVVLGVNRDLHGKPTGVRTLGLVCLGSALAVLSIHAVTGTDASRVIQGIVTLEYQNHVEHYQSGEVYTEPIGVVHRARNPHADLSAAFVGFWITAADRPHLAAVTEPPWAPPSSQHPYLRQAT